jgi:hypothetical protein
MNRLGKYCKAYTLDDLRKFSGWSEGAREEQGQNGGVEAQPTGETDLSNILFLQEDYTVTAGIFLDENVIFDNVTPEWIEFCRETLKFDAPAIEPGDGNSEQASTVGV